MSQTLLLPLTTPPHAVVDALHHNGYAVLNRAAVGELTQCSLDALDAMRPDWNDLPADAYLKDGGHYRRRRHACFVVDAGEVTQVAHRAHWQPLEYNALHGGMQRWFEPMLPSTLAHSAWAKLLLALAAVHTAATQGRVTRWSVEAHQFRIDTTDGIGRPTPEGAHRDGVDFVAVFLIARQGIKGGETRVFEAEGPNGQRFTLTQPWSLLLLDDARVVHESTPIQPTGEAGSLAYRDTLVLTYRAQGFQGDAVI
jgi:hypothetical protein